MTMGEQVFDFFINSSTFANDNLVAYLYKKLKQSKNKSELKAQMKKPTFGSWKLRNFHAYAHDQSNFPQILTLELLLSMLYCRIRITSNGMPKKDSQRIENGVLKGVFVCCR